MQCKQMVLLRGCPMPACRCFRPATDVTHALEYTLAVVENSHLASGPLWSLGFSELLRKHVAGFLSQLTPGLALPDACGLLSHICKLCCCVFVTNALLCYGRQTAAVVGPLSLYELRRLIKR